jgi:hypothetical protein
MLSVPSHRSWRAVCTSAARFARFALFACALLATRICNAAENLELAPGLSFIDDSSSVFPIQGDALSSAEIEPGRAAVVFFGASNCWNTNREAERLVAIYPKFRDRVSFIVVDVNHPSQAQRSLVDSYYHGSIPTIAVLAADGTAVYARAGETARERGDSRELARLLEKALAR